MIKTHKNIRNVLGDLLASEDYNKNLLEVLKKNVSIDFNDIVSSLNEIYDDGGDLLKSKATVEEESVLIKRNKVINKNYSGILEQILNNEGEFITELRLFKHLETIIINTQFLLNLNFKISFLSILSTIQVTNVEISKFIFCFSRNKINRSDMLLLSDAGKIYPFI